MGIDARKSIQLWIVYDFYLFLSHLWRFLRIAHENIKFNTDMERMVYEQSVDAYRWCFDSVQNSHRWCAQNEYTGLRKSPIYIQNYWNALEITT